ncbi:MAG: IS3 family transposase [Myxococcota bacterium]
MKEAVLELVAKTRERSGWPVERTLSALGVTRSVYFEWLQRRAAGRLEDAPPVPPRLDRLLADEEELIRAFALAHPRVGYRKLTWMMVDRGVAYASESAVYRVLREAELMSRWKKSTRSPGEYRFRPTGPNQQWHTDVMYVWVAGRHYFLLSFVDAFSRYIVHHKLLIDLNGKAVATELLAALEALPAGQRPRIVHDHGSEFCNKELQAVVKAHDLIDIATRPRHPESNGIAERFNGTVRDESEDVYGSNYLEAERRIERIVREYCDERLHAALGYIEPKEVHFGDPERRKQLRADKLALGREIRRQRNRLRSADQKAA